MTFDEAIRVIKKGDIVRLRHELDNGLRPDLSNDLSGTVLMTAAMEGRVTRVPLKEGALLVYEVGAPGALPLGTRDGRIATQAARKTRRTRISFSRFRVCAIS